ncbi:aspartate aminotransferase family protein [Corynebacterium sp.]|uniref:pyridoxal phosphate-dependent decarboxylase family protein n=1 Tax=Corynebacterium sp. TaxID=1720 RepID=UPI0026DCE571|nr:aspartate aminotransferase family protein [Corynebacterium sp.]MDO4609980.1 aspartate aminotransferase family protein [Corynebacterium sp.]
MRSPQSPPAGSIGPAPTNDFLGDGHSVTQALHAVEPVLSRALAPLGAALPGQNQDEGSSCADDLRDRIAAIDLAHPLGELSDALEELSPIWLGNAVRYDSPRYLAHLNCPITAPSFAASVVATGMNTAVETWDQARGAALIEDRLIHWLAELTGMDARQASGVFTSGGTQSNLQALYTAREKALAAGASMDELVVLCSAEAHYSVFRSCHLLGLPDGCIQALPTLDSGALDPAALAEAVHRARSSPAARPMCVVLTAGTTDLGAIDPLAESIAIARDLDTHVHVDCAYGGALLVSPARRRLLDGLHLADTFSVDFHKSFFQPVACSALVYRDHRDLRHVSWHAEYLNPQADGRLNLADRSLQTTRGFDALKLWLTLRTTGADAIGRDFDACCDLAAAAAQLAHATPDIEVLTRPNLSTLLFRYAPGHPSDRTTHDLDSLNTAIRRHLFDANLAIIGSTRRRGATWLKFTLLNPNLTLSDVEEAFTLIQDAGHQLDAHTPHLHQEA